MRGYFSDGTSVNCTHTHTSASIPSEMWISPINYANVNFLVLKSYYKCVIMLALGGLGI